MEAIQKAKFSLGRIVITPKALRKLREVQTEAFVYLFRHASGDWGETSEMERIENNDALEHGYQLMSVYRLNTWEEIWIITEADRAATTVLLPVEY